MFLPFKITRFNLSYFNLAHFDDLFGFEKNTPRDKFVVIIKFNRTKAVMFGLTKKHFKKIIYFMDERLAQ